MFKKGMFYYMKKIFKVMLVLTMFFLCFAENAYCSNISFTDVDASHWAYSSIEKSATNGIIGGYEDGSFRPEANITRGEFCKMLSTALKLPISATDTGMGWAYPYMLAIQENTWYYQEWYLQEFDPDAIINRGEVSIALCDAYTKKPLSLDYMMDEVHSVLASHYKDWESIGGFSEAVYTMTTNNIMNGYEDGCFHPEYNITRAEMCAILDRAFAIEANANDQNMVANRNNDTNYDYSISYNKLKTGLIKTGEKISGDTYAVFYNYNNLNLTIITLVDTPVISFMVECKAKNQTTLTSSLMVFENGNAPGILSKTITGNGTEYVTAGVYKAPQLTILSSDLPATNDTLLKFLNSGYRAFDSLMALKGIDVKISDFGIDY